MTDSADLMTDRARQVMALARVEADKRGHKYIGTEHILLGLIAENGGIASGVIESMGVGPKMVAAIDFIVGAPEEVPA